MKKKELQNRILTSLALLPFVVVMILFNKYTFAFLVSIVIFIAIYEWIKINKKKITLISLSGILFLLLALYFSFFLRVDINNKDIPILFLWILFICFFSDSGGFIFGKFFKGKKITKLSPNKTYAGVFGSFIFSIFPVFIFNYFSLLNVNIFINISFKNILLSIFFSCICQLGDITISYFKRKNKIKDTGKILPGHGGILDRIDGIIFVIVASGFLKLFQII